MATSIAGLPVEGSGRRKPDEGVVRYRYKKAGVMLVNLVKADTVGGGLFDERDDPRALARMKMLDGLNARFGRDASTFGRTGARRPWLMRNEMLSQRFTTDWDDLLAV